MSIADQWLRHEKTAVNSLLVAGAIVCLALAVSSVRDDSATSDEPAHIVNGLIKLRYGDFDFFREQPPLMNSLSALPLAIAGANLDGFWRTERENHWRVGFHFLYESGNDAATMLFLARLPTIALFLALCFVVYAWVAEATGSRTAAALSFMLTAFCPNLLAHGRLATVDLGATFFIVASIWTFLRLLDRPTAARVAVCGLLTAGAALSKVSGLILVPFLGVVSVVWLLLQPASEKRTPDTFSHSPSSTVRGMLAKYGLVILVAFVIVEVVYLAEMSRWYMTDHYPETGFAGRLAIPVLEYTRQLAAVQRWVGGVYDKPQFLLGQYSYSGWWYYYPLAILLKTPIGSLLLGLFSLIVFVRTSPARLRSAARDRTWVHLAIALLFVIIYLGVSMRSNIDLGIRYVLPIYPLMYAGIGMAVAMNWRISTSTRHVAFVLLLAIWSIGSTVSAHPGYLSYFNEAVHGRDPSNYLIDSNLDWGQDLKRLGDWCRYEGVSTIFIDYFGGGDVHYDLGRGAVRWPIPNPRLLPRGYFAVSRHLYRSSFLTRELGMNDDEYLARSRATYVTTIGGSIDVYRVE